MTRRITKLAAVSLLLGLVTTWAVAWGSAFLVDVGSGQTWAYERAGPPHRVVGLGRGATWSSYELKQCVSGTTLARVVESENRTNLTLRLDYELPHIASDLALIDGESMSSRVMLVVARGWPWRASATQLLVRQDRIDGILGSDGPDYWIADKWRMPSRQPPAAFSLSAYESRHALLMAWPSSGGANSKVGTVMLPCSPLWPGLLADTLFYALLFAALHQLTAWGRRSRRRRRGRCAACGYDLSGLDSLSCPECGHTP